MWKAILNKVFKARERLALNLDKGDEEKPFLEHLEDLRTMIVRMAITLLVSSLGTFIFYVQLYQILLYPLVLAGFAKDLAAANGLLIVTDVAGPFMTAVNIALIAGIVLAFPVLLYFLLQFILPGLKHGEKKLLFPSICIGGGLFLLGCTFSYWLVLPRALAFFSDFAGTLGAKQMWTLDGYITFSTRFILVFGVSFELPVIVMALVKLDILNYRLMMSTWRHALVIIAVFAAVITPTQDILTLLLMSGPLYVLYGICIFLAYRMEKKDREQYPEYYAELKKDEEALAKEAPTDDWDREDYNPWSTAENDEDDDEGYRKPTTQAPEEPKPSADEPVEDKSKEDQANDKRDTD